MTYEEAIRARLTARTARNELKAHDVLAVEAGDALFDEITGEKVAKRGVDGLYSGRSILNYLGY